MIAERAEKATWNYGPIIILLLLLVSMNLIRPDTTHAQAGSLTEASIHPSSSVTDVGSFVP